MQGWICSESAEKYFKDTVFDLAKDLKKMTPSFLPIRAVEWYRTVHFRRIYEFYKYY